MSQSINRRRRASGAIAAGTAAVLSMGALLGLASSASAADSPLPWMATELSTANGFAEQQGTLTFYDADGHPITSGALDVAPFAAYAVASGGLISGDTNAAGATALMYTPAASDPALWGNTQISVTAPLGPGTNTQYTALPADIRSSDREVVPLALDVNTSISEFPSSYPAPNDKVYEVRVIGDTDQKWYSADIEIDTATNTWTQVYPVPAAVVVDTAISTITADPASPAPGGTTSVALSATLSATDSSHPAGSVHVFNGSTDLGAATLDAGTGAITATATVQDGTNYNFKFVFTPTDTGAYHGSSSAVLAYSVGGASATSISSITATPVSPARADTTSVALKATLSAANGTHPNGWVHLYNGSTDLGSATLTASTGAIAKTATVAAGGHYNFKFVYVPAGPDGLLDGYGTSASAVLAYAVNPKAATTTAVTVSPASPVYGTAWKATIAVAAGSTGIVPTGAVTLKYGSTTLGSGSLAAGKVTLTIPGTKLTPGARALTASFPGSFSTLASTGHRTITVAKEKTSQVITVSPAAPRYGTAYKVTVQVKGTVVPTGNVTLKYGSASLGTKALSGGKAVYTVAGTRIPVGARTVTATYAGSTVAAASTGSKRFTVQKATSASSGKLADATIRKTVAPKLTATVKTAGVAPTGKVSIYDGSRVIKTVTLSAKSKGKVVVVLPKRPHGVHKIKFVYSGSGTVLKSTSNVVKLVVS